MLRGDNVKDEEGCSAVFTEQGASASQMAAAKFLDTISKLPGLVGETSDANSPHSQVKMTEALRLLRLPLEVCPEIWIRIVPRQKNVKVWKRLKTTWYIMNGTYMVIHVAAFFGKAKFFFLKPQPCVSTLRDGASARGTSSGVASAVHVRP